MSLKERLESDVGRTFREQWEVQTTHVPPAPEDLRLGSNHAKDLDQATILYADLDGSTNMVDQYDWMFSAEVYKTYLRCAADIIRDSGGVVTAYDGDRIMAVFTGDSKNTSAVRCALKINFAVLHIIQPALNKLYPQKNFTLKHVVGIDTSHLRTARTGVRGDNDLVWVGRAANYAAKLTSLPGKTIWITKAVHDKIASQVKVSSGRNMWTEQPWTQMGGITIYGSNYFLSFE